MSLASYIDHTILKPEATISDIKKLCDEAVKYNFKAVCINPVFVSVAKELLKASNVKIATVVGFPLGANMSYTKVKETEKAISDGADEIDMVMSVGLFKSGDFAGVESDIKAVADIASNQVVKVILETGFLTPDEIAYASKLSISCGANFVKTSTGFGPRGASVEDIYIMKKAIGDTGEIKASGGIRDVKFAKELIEAGATRIGTSSGIKIVSGE